MADSGQPLPPCPHCRAAHPEELLVCPNTNRLLPLEGRMLDGRFRFIRKLGEGGMSTVWMAENVRVRKRVAIKLMHPEYARNPKTLHRFQNEATAAGRIGNPHICDILDFGESPLGPYMVMEMLQGQSFAELLDSQGRIDPPLAVLIIREALKGLTAAHKAGIIHRDLKPENVFLHEPEPGRMLVKLMDFGISKFTEDPGGGKTGANVVMGTPEYMSPEQAAGAANVDARTDIWAMGVMLYRALAGIEPFTGKTMAALLLALTTEDHAPVTQHTPNLPPGLVAIVDRCLAKEPQYRYATADELLDALAPYQQMVAEGERPIAPVRTGKTVAIPVGMIPTTPPTSGAAPLPVPLTSPVAPLAGEHGPAALAGGPAPAPALQPDSAPAVAIGGPPPGAVRNRGRGPGSGPGTWSSELDSNVAGSEQSWSMGKRSLAHDGDERPDRRESSGGWGWLIGIGVVALLGGGAVALGFSLGWFDGARTTVAADGGAETGSPGESGSGAGEVAVGETGVPADLPTSTTGATGGETADTGASGDSGAGASTGADDSGGSADSGGSTSAGGSGGDSGGSTDPSDSGNDSGDDSGDDSGGSTTPKPRPKPKDPPFEPSALIKASSLYTHAARGPSSTWEAAKAYCRNLDRKKKHGLSQWRMATTAEIKSFRETEVAKLQYWSSETSGDKAKVVVLAVGKVEDKPLTDPAPRPFCVSKR